MAQYNFEGDIDNIANRQLEFIHNVISELGYKNNKASFAPVGKAGDNYAATVKRITIEGEDGTFTIIVKLAPTIEAIRTVMNSEIFFTNEHKMYYEVLPKLDQFQKDAGIPEEDQLKFAKCYGSLSGEPNEVILLEDLRPRGFIMLDRFVSLTDDTIKSVLKNFAVFHSLSYVLRYKEPEKYNEYKRTLKDMWSIQVNNEEMKAYLQNLEDDTLKILDDTEHSKFLRHKIKDTFKSSTKVSTYDYDSKYAVIIQGDAWTNNIMFRFEDNILAESIMIDYQLSRIASPVSDLMYMIFNCTDHEMRMKHYHDWIDYYHSELEKSLSNFNLKIDFVYPRHELDADLKRYGDFALVLSVTLASMLLRKPDEAAKILDAMKSENIMGEMLDLGVGQLDDDSKDLFKRRVIGLIDSFTEFGLLSE